MHGDLVYVERMDGTPLGSTTVCQDKARSAARFKRPTKAFQDMLASGPDGLLEEQVRRTECAQAGVAAVN